ncbi:MAG TPA: AsmA-like C-terminal domain-containing protein [Parvibaculum sp.]|uniref:YhdP family protein n=1 Tax=Parvibaculum sp. TaxID=2024848 RepID=UPI002CCF9FD4|nr:AsmA-like C-terminal domain-containing protein [Parvibaculum sp.]HMM14678.1 AsmA-like C-terminal domain-containing protein [Parvibaculum sp.]
MEIVGVAVAAMAVLLAVLAWRLSTGPISLPIMNQMIEDAVRRDLQGGRLTVDNTVLIWTPEDQQLGFRLANVRLTGADGNLVAAIPDLQFRLSVPALLVGRLAPTYVDFYGVQASIVRRPGTGVSLGLASAGAAPAAPTEGDASALLAPMFEALATGNTTNSVLGYLRHVGMRNATLRFIDEVNGITFEAPDANLAMYRGAGGGVAGSLIADIRIGDTMSHVELNGTLPRGGTSLEVGMRAMNVVPAALARMSPAFANYAMFDAPIGATGTLNMRTDGSVASARLMLEAGKGTFTLPGLQQAPVALEKAHAEIALDALAHRLDLKQLVLQAGPHSVSLVGRVDYTLGAGLNVSSARVELSGGKTTTQMAGFFEGPVELDDIRFDGLLDFDKRSLAIDEVSLGVAGGGRIAASGTIGEGPRSPSVNMSGTMTAIPVETVRAIWPLPLSHNAREWVSENMKGGMLNKGSFRVDAPADMLADADNGMAIPNERIRFEFDVTGTTISYLDKMPPMTGVAARGLLQGDRFDAWVNSASVALSPGRSIAVSNGHFADGALADKHSIGEIELSATGATADILGLLNHEPLKLIGGFGLDPATVGGSGTLSARLRLPLVKDVKIDDVDFSGKARAEKISIPNIQKDLSVTDGALDIDVQRTGLKAKGTVSINGSVPLKLVWSESFVPTRGPGSVFELSGYLDDASRTAVGLPLTEFISGTAEVQAKFTGRGSAITNATVHAELSAAIAKVDDLAWMKPVGKPATADLKVEFIRDAYRISDFVLAGEGIDAKGGFTIDNAGHILAADFPVVKLGPSNDLALKAKRDQKGTLVLDISGAKADARGLIQDFISGSGDKAEAEKAATRMLTPEMEQDPSLRSLIRANVAEVAAQNDTKFTGLKASFTQIDGEVFVMELSGTDRNGGALAVEIRGGADRTREFFMHSPDAGYVLSALDLMTSARGGTLNARAVIDDKLPGSPMKGEFAADKFRIVNAPVLASILTLGSLTGIRDTLNGEGIYFDSLKLPFNVTGHRIRVEDARMSGPAIGLTMNGEIDRARNVTVMEGTLVPAYTINSILGNVPLLGPLIVGRQGEGVFGFTYTVKGDIDNPSVIVNPLSAIAPGFLRRLFEFSKSLPPEAPAPVAPSEAETPEPRPVPLPAVRPEAPPAAPLAPANGTAPKQ